MELFLCNGAAGVARHVIHAWWGLISPLHVFRVLRNDQ